MFLCSSKLHNAQDIFGLVIIHYSLPMSQNVEVDPWNSQVTPFTQQPSMNLSIGAYPPSSVYIRGLVTQSIKRVQYTTLFKFYLLSSFALVTRK